MTHLSEERDKRPPSWFQRQRVIFSDLSWPDKVRYFLGPIALSAALGGGVVAVIFFTHRESAVCDVTSVGAEHAATRGFGYLWTVETSCGTYSINTGGLAISESQGRALAASLRTTPGENRYLIEFQGWGVGRSIVGATPSN